MTFHDFMAAALYDPAGGYYAADRARIGRGGDFFTNVSVGPLFGQLLATQFEEMWTLLGEPADFWIVEQGAHAGDFARDVLTAVTADFRKALRYRIVEPAPALRARQEKSLRDFSEKVAWSDSVAALAPFCGVHFSNELLDAFPVHRVRFAEGNWRECCVDADLRPIDRKMDNPELRARIAALPLPEIENYETEINLEALTWIDQLAGKLWRGYVLAIDYGYPRAVFYAPGRARGTLSACAQHRRISDPWHRPGETDLTAQVDFTSLAERAARGGFHLAGFTDQHHFMTALARDFFASHPPDAKQARAFQTLMHPQFLGTVFKVLALEKPPVAAEKLRGFAFARDPRIELGL